MTIDGLRDLIVDIHCAERDGLRDYVMECRKRMHKRDLPTDEKVGDTIVPLGCPLTQRLRETDPWDENYKLELHKIVKIFDWGFCLDDGSNCSYCWVCIDGEEELG